MNSRKKALLFGVVILPALFLVGVLSAQQPQQIGAIATPQINSTFYVGTITGFYPSIQSAVNAACATSGAAVDIPAGTTPTDTIAAVAGGCTTAGIIDHRVVPSVSYTWSGSAYTAVSSGGAVSSVTALGISGPASLNSGVLNIPNYTPAGVTIQIPSGASTVTLTSSQAANHVLNITSATTLTSPVTVIIPVNIGQNYIIQNQTTGIEFISMGGSTGAKVNVSQSASNFIYCNGVDYIKLGGTDLVFTSANNNFTGINDFSLGIGVGGQTPATPGSNVASPPYVWLGGFCLDSSHCSAGNEQIVMQITPVGTGFNPPFKINFTQTTGSSGGFFMDLPANSTLNSSPICTVASGCGAASISAAPPMQYSSGVISIQSATDSQAGAMTATDHAALTSTIATATTALSRTSQAVKYTSALGGVPAINGILSGASAIGATDNAPALNAALAGGNVKLVVDQPLAVNTTLLLGSNTTVECLPGMGFIEMPSTNLPLIQNATAVSAPTSCSATTSDGVGDGGFVTSNFCQSNIKITGCYLNANNLQSITNADHKTGLTGLWTTTVQMLGVQGLELSGNTVVNSPAYNFSSNNVDTYRVHDNVITSSLGFGSNTDGIHLNGPMSNVWLENNKIAVGDDSIALNADDGYKPMGGVAPTPAVAFPGWTWGAITDVSGSNNHFIGSAEGIRLLSTKSLIDHVSFRNTWGTVQENGLNIGHYVFAEGQGNMGQVGIDGFDVTSSGTLAGLSLASTIYLQGSLQSFSLRNVTMRPAATANPFIKLQNLAPASLAPVMTIDGLNINNVAGTQNTTSLIQTAAPATPINNLVISNVNWLDGPGNTGTLIGGAQVPNSLTVSGFAGSHARLLAPGYSPLQVFGDGYIPTTTYVSTMFNEGAAGAVLNGTVPATTVAGAAWVNTAGGWLYQSGGGLKSNGVASSFATLNIGQSTNYAIYAKRAATAGQTGFQTVFRFQDTSNYDVVNFAAGAFVIVDMKAGVGRTVATTTCTGIDLGENTAVVSVVGNHVTASVPGCSVSVNLPTDSAVLAATNVGFDSSTTSTNISLLSFIVANQ